MDISEIKKVLDWVEEFQEESKSKGAINRKEFAQWLLAQEPVEEVRPHLDGNIAMYIGMLYNYTTFYCRRIFKNSEIYSIIDHSFLMGLMPDQKKTKSQLIQETIMEKSSGTEVIKRLLKQGMIEELDNPADRRTKLVRLTEKGLANVMGLAGAIAQVSAVVTGDLTTQEKMDLVQVLERLHFFHWDHFTTKKEPEIQEMLKVS